MIEVTKSMEKTLRFAENLSGLGILNLIPAIWVIDSIASHEFKYNNFCETLIIVLGSDEIILSYDAVCVGKSCYNANVNLTLEELSP
jgi:hypothetical protein